MPRGPFQGTWVNSVRPTVVTAPDAIVYVNGSAEAIGCPVCKKKFPFNKYITSIQDDLSIDSPGSGSASFTMSVPRHAIDDFFFNGTSIISEMMEIEIYAKGFYLVEGLPQYYPIFWGLVTEVSESYSGGEHTVTVHCADILKWWEICKMATNSAMTSPNPGAMGMSIFGNAFFGMNPYDIIWTLAQQSFGDVIVGTGSLVSIYRESTQKNTFTAALSDIMIYWEQRFQSMRSNLLLYGVNGVAVRGDSLYETMRKGGAKLGQPFASKAVSVANGGTDGGQMVYDPTASNVTAFRGTYNTNVPLWSSEYQTKLELATAAKEAIGFEFYMDVDGTIVFKPPFYNLDILSNKPISWIQDIDIIDSDFSRSESEVITQIILQGNLGGTMDLGFGEEATPFTSVTDYHLLRQFGWRSQTMNSEFLSDPNAMFYVGLDQLDRWNARRNRATVTIPMRPELRLGFPIYVAYRDEVWYITGISHNISFGGRAQTTLTLTAKRGKWIAPKGIGKFERKGFLGGAAATTPGQSSIQYTSRELSRYGQFRLTAGDAASLPPVAPPVPGQESPYDPLIMRHPKTGKIVGYPNAVMVFSRPFVAPSDTTLQDSGRRPSTVTPPQVLAKNQQAFQNTVKQSDTLFTQTLVASNNDTALREKYMNNRYHYGLNSAGAYIYAHDMGGAASGSGSQDPGNIQEIVLFPSANLEVVGTNSQVTAFKNSSTLVRPVSDERGFEVVGVFRYGRGVSLRDGRLVQSSGQKNAMANVDLQVALAGDLYAALNSQSQGLTSLISSYQNPADALARLVPDDLQTAGTISPDSKQPTFSNTEDNFLQVATLGSAEQKGLPSSVEAGTLSKALTLTEMTALTDDVQSDQNCACLLGRADLAFISQGYNLKTLSMPNSATPDNSSLDSSGLFASLTAPNQAAPVVDPQNVPQNPQDVANRIDTFLFNLYSQLDGVHQQYENALRGEPGLTDASAASAAQSDATLAQNIRFGNSGSGSPDLVPPFSMAGRAALGDPNATALAGSSALNDLASTFKSFGASLQTTAQKAQIQGDITTQQSQINSLQAQITKLSTASSIYLGDKSSTLANLQKQLAAAQQNLATDQAKLAALGDS